MSTTKADVNIHTTKIYATLDLGAKLKLGVENDSSDIKWTSNKKSIVTVSNTGVIKTNKTGKATIIENVDNEKYSFVIVVSDNEISPTPKAVLTMSPTPTIAPTATIAPTSTPIPTLSPTPSPTPTIAPLPTTIIQNSQDDKSITVYVTKTGSKYHRSGCRYLSRSQISISLSETKKYYSPYSVCDPPQ
jgi:hypothetical protein